MSNQKTSTDLRNVTFSQALAAGHTHCVWLVCPTTGDVGQDRVLASHSVLPEKAKELQMSATSGPLFGGSSPSADLQRSLGSKLQARLVESGSPEYALTWKEWDMLAEPPICALRASARRTSGNGCGGWPTAAARDYKDTPGMSETGTNPDGSERSRLDQLPRVAELTTPERSGGPAETEKQDEYLLDGWRTPT